MNFTARSLLLGALLLAAPLAAQTVNPLTDIRWPTCSSGQPYAPATNTCIAVVGVNQANTYGAFLQDFSAASVKLPAGFLSGDCTWTALGVITCTKSNGTAFGTAAFDAATAFDASGAAATAQSNAETYAQSVNTTGTAAGLSGSKTANYVYAGPASGSASTATWRLLVAADIPSLSSLYCSLGGCTLTGGLIGTTANFSGAVQGASFNSVLITAFGTDNVNMGGALSSGATGTDDTASGYNSLGANTSGSENTAYGAGALQLVTTGSNNTALGTVALASSTGSYNTAVGDGALQFDVAGGANTAVGFQALLSDTSGSGNVAVGDFAGESNTGLVDGVFVGYDAAPSSNSDTNEIVIGYGATGHGSNTATLGNSSITALYVPGLKASSTTSCMQVDTSGNITNTGSACGTGSGSGTVTSFAAPSGSWPTWLVPTVTNSTSAPSLAVAASPIPNSALAYDTISGIALGSNLDTLTFGTHLTSGASSYNGSAAATITSDATNANTASTIVARDASGNFSAGTVSAALSGNATTATNLSSYPTLCSGGQFSEGLSSGSNNCATPSGGGTTTNALTMNNSGSGASSGTTFNGSAAETISYNTVGASPLAGSTSLTTLGTVTAGTWHGTAIAPAYGGTGADGTGYAYGNGSSNFTYSTTIPTSALSGTVNATEVNGATVPASQTCLGSNSSSQLIAGTCGTGTVTTTGSPASGNIAAFSGTSSITPATSAQLQTAIGSGIYQASGTYVTPTTLDNGTLPVSATTVTASGLVNGGNDAYPSSGYSNATTSYTAIMALPTVPAATRISGVCAIYWSGSSTSLTPTLALGLSSTPGGSYLDSMAIYANGTYVAPTFTGISSTTTTAVTGAMVTTATSTEYMVLLHFTDLNNGSPAQTVTLYGKSNSTSYTLSVSAPSTCWWTP